MANIEEQYPDAGGPPIKACPIHFQELRNGECEECSF